MKKRSQSLTGRSFSDGIELSMQGKYSFATLKEGKIITENTKKKFTNMSVKQIKDSIVKGFLVVILIIPICLISNFADIILYTSIATFLEIILFGLIISDEAKEYHAAEHMIIDAFIKYQRIPTMKEVKETSQYSPMCGSNNVLFCSITLFWVGLYVKYTSRGMLYIISCMIIINMILYVNNLYKFIQIFLLKKPSDKKLNLALVALEGLVKQLK